MKLKELAKKPELTKVTVDSEVIVKAYGEPLEFWMWDRQDIPTYLQLAQLKEDHGAIFNVVRKLVLDEDGKPALEEDDTLPIDVMIPVVEKAITQLGNMTPQTSAT